MYLRVDFAEFPDAVRRELGHSTAYVRAATGGTLLTASDGKVTVVAITPLDLDQARNVLQTAEMVVHRGGWALEVTDWEPEDGSPSAYVAAIAYKAEGNRIGLWVDAFPYHPTPAQALHSMYEEFREHGEIGDATYDEFVRVADANVIILTPGQLGAFSGVKSVPAEIEV